MRAIGSYMAQELARKYGTSVEQIETWVHEGQLEGTHRSYGLSIPADQIPILLALIKGDPDPQGTVAKAHASFADHFEALRESEEVMKAKRYPPKKGGELEKFLHRNRLPQPKKPGDLERPMVQKDNQ